MALKRISIHDFLLAMEGDQPFEVKYASGQSGADAGEEIFAFHLEGDFGAFTLLNQMVAMSKWSPETNCYTDDVFETVVLSGPWGPDTEVTDKPPGPFEVSWPGGGMTCGPVIIRPFTPAGRRIQSGLIHAQCFDGRVYEYLAELWFEAASGDTWILKGAKHPPEMFVLTAALPVAAT